MLHLHVGPQLQALDGAVHLQEGVQVHGLHLHCWVIGELLSSMGGMHVIACESNGNLNVAAGFDRLRGTPNAPFAARVEGIPVIGRGRIVIWEGASLWMLKAEQAIAELRAHAHHAIQLTFQLEGVFEIEVANERLTGPVTAIASDAPHNFRASGAVAFLFIAPESPVGRALSQAVFVDRPYANMSNRLVGFLDDLRQCFDTARIDDAAIQLGRRILSSLPLADESVLPDARVLAMIDYARKHLDDVVTLPASATSIGLSESRARHLFVAHTGLPFKTYVLWLRLERAVALIAMGKPLTQAAHEAGFADSAHFSRTFKRTFGLPAAALRFGQG